MKHILIVGTDTNIGKTVLSLALLDFFKDFNPLYYKPIQCGTYPIQNNLKEGGDSDWIQNKSPFIKTKNTYFFKNPVSPHYACELEDKTINLNFLKEEFSSLATSELVITESAGGLCVPLNRKGQTLLEVIPQNSHVILACSPYLGTLNHTLLSHNYLKQSNIIPSGFVMIHSKPTKPSIFENNVKTIQNLSSMSYFGEIPYLKEIKSQQKINCNKLHQNWTSSFHHWSKNFLL